MRDVHIIVDNREKNVEVIEGLSDRNIRIAFAQLPVGDYVVSDRMCVERKTVKDFESSIMDARLFDQAKRLSESFSKPVILIEGSIDASTLARNVITGAMLGLYSDYNIQLLQSSSASETAYILSKLAEREQVTEVREPRLIGAKKAFSINQWQVLILSSIPGIGPKLANALIKKFKTVKRVTNASVEELTEVDKIGKKKAERIYNVLNIEFSEDGGNEHSF